MINQEGPPEGPKTVPLELDMSIAAAYFVDLTEHITNKWLSYVQGIYIDNASNDYPLIVIVNGSNQRVIAPANSQGWFPVLATNPPIFRIYQEDTDGAGVVKLQFVNHPVIPHLVQL